MKNKINNIFVNLHQTKGLLKVKILTIRHTNVLIE